MTITNSTIRLSTDGDGTTVVFPASFPFYEEGELVVILVAADGTEMMQSLTTHYTVAGGDGLAGSITMVLPPPAGQRVVRYRASPLTQETDYAEGDAFPADSHEAALDKLTMQNQEQADKLARSLSLPETSEVSGDVLIDEPVAGRPLKWNAAADGIENGAIDLEILETNVATDAAQVALDRMATAADVVTTSADATASGADALQTGADRVQTGLDRIATTADAVSTADDAVATASDAATTTIHAASTATDAASTLGDAVTTAGHATTTTTNALQTAADAVATAADIISSANNASVAASNANSAAASAQTAEAAAAGIYWKAPCYVATSANLTLSGEQTLDGVLTSASRVLVKDQTSAAENGIYTSAAGAWSRTTPMDTWAEFIGATVVVSNGGVFGDKAYMCTVDAGGTLGTTDITWADFGAAPIAISVTVDNYTAGTEFTAGSTTQLTLSTAQANENNIVVNFDGITQHHDTYTLSGAVVTFSSAIPVGVAEVEVRGAAALGIGETADGTVTTVKISDGAVTEAKILDGAVTRDKMNDDDVRTLSSLLPQVSKSTAYTCVLTDAGKHIYHPSADTTARVWTIPANASVAYAIGTAITFINDDNAGVVTIAITTDTLVWAVDATTGSRTLAAPGMVTAVKVTSTRWMISGAGLT